MGWAGHVAPMGEKRSEYMFWGKAGRKHDTGKYRWRILKCILQKQDMRIRTVLSGTETNGGLFSTRQQIFGFHTMLGITSLTE
jgi:hypothetical protein